MTPKFAWLCWLIGHSWFSLKKCLRDPFDGSYRTYDWLECRRCGKESR